MRAALANQCVGLFLPDKADQRRTRSIGSAIYPVRLRVCPRRLAFCVLPNADCPVGKRIRPVAQDTCSLRPDILPVGQLDCLGHTPRPTGQCHSPTPQMRIRTRQSNRPARKSPSRSGQWGSQRLPSSSRSGQSRVRVPQDGKTAGKVSCRGTPGGARSPPRRGGAERKGRVIALR